MQFWLNMTPKRTLALLLPVALFALAVRPLTDPDLWWHLRTGQWIVENGSAPRTDFFSFTMPGTPWVDHEWLGEAGLYLLYRAGGPAALILSAALVIVGTFVGVYRLSELRPHVAVFTTIAAALATALLWDVRLQIATLMFAVFCLLILRRAKQGKRRWLWVLPPLFLLWANVHAGFMLGLVLLGTAWVGDAGEYILATRFAGRVPPPAFPPETPSARYLIDLAAAGMLSGGATLINPYGLELYRASLATFSNQTFHRFIIEWHAPDLQDPRFLPYVALWGALIAGLALSERRPTLTDMLYVLGFGFMAWQAARNIPFFVITAAPLITRQVATWRFARSTAQSTQPLARRLIALDCAVLALAGLACLLQAGTMLSRVPDVMARAYPIGAADYIARERPAGPLLNSYNFGGYLIWRLQPAYPVFIDGRAEFIYSDAFVAEYYNRMWQATGDWQAYLDRYGIRLIVIEADGALSRQVAQSSVWQSVYADQTAVVYQRRAQP
jgi:hypothetical protein